MLVVSKSKQARQDRVNADSMVSFDGVSQYASAGVNPNVSLALQKDKSFTISVFCQLNSDANHNLLFTSDTLGLNQGIEFSYSTTSGGRWYIQMVCLTGVYQFYIPFSQYIHKLVHLVFCYDGTTKTGQYYINGAVIPTQSYKTNTGFSTIPAHELIISEDTSARNRWSGYISHLLICNRTATPHEIRHIHAFGGLLPSSLHSAVVAHYPCTHAEGDVLVDVTDQYNYAKDLGVVKSANYHANKRFLVNGAVASNYTEGDRLTHDPASPNASNAVYNGDSSVYVGKGEYVRIKLRLHSQQRADARLQVQQFSSANGGVYISLPVVNTTTDFEANIQNEGTVQRKLDVVWQLGTDCDIEILEWRKSTTPVGYLDPYHAQLRNYTLEQHTGAVQTAWKDFYTKNPYQPYVDSNDDGIADVPLTVKKSLLPPLSTALQIQAVSKAQRMQLDGSLTESKGGEMHFFLYLDRVPSGAERYLFTSQHNSSQTHFYIQNGKRLKFENLYGPGVIRMQSDVISIQKGWNHFGIKCGNVGNANSFRFYHQGRYVDNNVVTHNYNSIYNDFFPKYMSRQYLFTAWASSNNTFPANTQLDCRLVAFYANRGVFTKHDKEILEAYNNGLFQGMKQVHTVLYGEMTRVYIDEASENFQEGHNWTKQSQEFAVDTNTGQAVYTGVQDYAELSIPLINLTHPGVGVFGQSIRVEIVCDSWTGGNKCEVEIGDQGDVGRFNSVGTHVFHLRPKRSNAYVPKLWLRPVGKGNTFTISSVKVIAGFTQNHGTSGGNATLENYTSSDESPIIPIDRFQAGELDTNYCPYPTIFNNRTARISWNTDVDETKFSVSFWYYATGYNGSIGANNLFCAQLAGGGFITVKYLNPSGPLYFAWAHTDNGNSNAERTSLSIPNARIGNWTHVALTFDQNVQGKFNRHGSQVASSDNVFLAGVINSIGFFGSTDSNENPAPAFVRNLQVYNAHVLTTAEIDELRALGHNAINPPLHLADKLSLHAPCMQKSGVPMDLISGERAYMEESSLQWAKTP